MKHPYLILAIILMITLLLIVDRLDLKNRRMQDGADRRDPPDRRLPGDKVANDKLILVEGMNEVHIKRIIRDFCGWHNREMLQVIPVVTKMTDLLFAITFPYDVPFEIFCTLINYLNYPKGYNRRFYAMGWATTRSTDMWMTAENTGKPVLLFVPDLDMEYDHVLMTTADQLGYQLNFSAEKARLLERPARPYHIPPFTAGDLEAEETVTVDFKGR
ncbi:hypothetical protein [Niabella sp.]|uniref:hypothetical protein n=1 Tax=Niabella sp. TaxID=1962976 RepID=UPI00261B5919|nr:hypothetical protein [Niabella sp.]